MRILFVTPFLPYPPDADGTRLIIWNLAVELSKRHELHLLALSNKQESAGTIDAVRECFRSVMQIPVKSGLIAKIRALLRTLVSGRPYGIEKFHAPHVLKELNHLVDTMEFDAVHVDSYIMSQYACARENVLTVLSAHDARSLTLQDRLAVIRESGNGVMTRLLAREVRLMQQYEGAQYARFDSCIVVGEKDKRHLKDLNPSLDVRVIPNGVRMERVAWEPPAEPHGIAFVGDIGYFPNEDAVLTFAHDIFPTIRQHVPDASFYVVGRNPSARVLSLQGEHMGIHVTGEVRDVREYIRRCGVSVAPLRYGSGVKNKILDACAVGRPVVASNEACTGLRGGFEKVILRTSSSSEMANWVIRVLNDTGLGENVGLRSMEFVREHHSWEQVSRRYEEAYQGRYE